MELILLATATALLGVSALAHAARPKAVPVKVAAKTHQR
ncbi:hypothetical protein M673_14920 [Aureimonas sp. AU20]|nr:hypothetical protein M673_14920 [Aureimonas sp. AU20]